MEKNIILEGGRVLDLKTGLVFPWYTSKCIEWLKTLDFTDKKVFEYGVGDSTLWYRAKGAYCIGVDSSYDWAQKVGAITAYTEQAYISTIEHLVDGSEDLFDIVIIDGDCRDKCTYFALMNLKSGGYLIIDNYHQSSVDPNIWKETDELIKGMPIIIYKEQNHEDWQTAVITKP